MTVQRAEQYDRGDVVALRQEQGEIVASSILRQFAADGAAAMQMALQIAPTPFVPESYKKASRDQWYTPERIAQNVAAAWLAGDEIGLRPMQSLQAIDIIEGRPALNARSMRALVQAHGHDVWVEAQPGEAEQTQKLSVTVAGQRKGSEHIERVTWTWRRAQQAELVGRKNWQKSPIDMLIARATSAVCRLIASDVLMGLAYSIEELQDEQEDGAPTPATTVRRGSSVRRQQPAEDPFAESSGGDEAGDNTPVEQEAPTVEVSVVREEEPDAQREQLDAVAVAESSVDCGVPKPDGSGAVCSRPQGHEGRHHYGAAPAATSQPEETPEEGAGERTETPEAPAVTTFEPTPEERADQEDEDLFAQPTDEEQEAAYEAERQARAERDAQQAAAGVPQGVTAAETVDNSGDDEGDDDPWADFQ
jgi:hypothetical protein